MNYPDNWGAIPGTEEMITLGNRVMEVGRYGIPTDTSAYVTEVGGLQIDLHYHRTQIQVNI